jgi:predicted ribosomally synthesized peptide with nif11-like leader
MSQMKELYDKVARDAALQMKFVKIVENSDQLSEAEVGKKQVAFAKELGFDVTKEEIDEFFKNISEQASGELSEDELDMVAGGKSDSGTVNVKLSVYSLGLYCALASADEEARGRGCSNLFK